MLRHTHARSEVSKWDNAAMLELNMHSMVSY